MVGIVEKLKSDGVLPVRNSEVHSALCIIITGRSTLG